MYMKKIPFIILLLAAFVVQGQQQNLLVTPQWLKENLKDPKLVILQVSFLKFEYDKEHIEGARFLWPEWLAPNSPYGNYNAPDPTVATELLRSYGIDNDSKIVLCHIRNEVPATARMFLTLENLGLRGSVYFLNGGLEAWKKEGFAVTNEPPLVKKGKFKATPSNLLVDKEYVLKTLNSSDGLVVDARMKNFYDGDPVGNPRNGHIAGAKNIPFPDLLDADNFNMFKPSAALQEYFTPVVPDTKKELVTYCFIGQTASVVYMAGRILGYNMKLYDGSMQEWSRLEELPMEETKK
jgi:thiosulfate/3-mercaptopyruvate sulfurtransferase